MPVGMTSQLMECPDCGGATFNLTESLHVVCVGCEGWLSIMHLADTLLIEAAEKEAIHGHA